MWRSVHLRPTLPCPIGHSSTTVVSAVAAATGHSQSIGVISDALISALKPAAAQVAAS